MRIDLMTLFPEILDVLQYGIVGRAINKGIMSVKGWNPRDYSQNAHRQVDDRPYGGGPGMVMQYQPLRDTLSAVQAELPAGAGPVVFLSPKGRLLDHDALVRFSQCSQMTLIAGRYEGIDQRFIDKYVDEEWSVGDFVVSGGELPAMLMIDGITRLLEGALGHPASAQQDSFSQGLLDHPHYTRPESIDGLKVPQELLSGDHAAIESYRLKESLGNTWQNRQDLLKRRVLSTQEGQLLDESIKEMLTEGNEHE